MQGRKGRVGVHVGTDSQTERKEEVKMLATEVIERLQQLVKMYGDRHVIENEGGFVEEINLSKEGNGTYFEINKELK